MERPAETYMVSLYPQKGNEAKVVFGKNVALSEDGSSIISTTEGILKSTWKRVRSRSVNTWKSKAMLIIIQET